jgi:hypothetical protein
MKFTNRVLIVLFLSTVFISCSKSDKADPPFIIEGEWIGKLGDGSAPPSGSLKWNIKTGGIIERVSSNGSISATGTWSLNGNTFNASYTFPNGGGTATFDGTVDKAKNKISGNWSNTGGEDGTYYVNKTDD